MLRDLYFYPLAALIIGGMIYFAMSLADYETASDKEILANGFIMEGPDLANLTASPGTNYEYVAATGQSPAFVKLWTHIAQKDVSLSAGVFAPLSSDYERVFAQERLRMTVTARASRNNPLSRYDVGYFTAGVGDSGWKTALLTEDWQEFSFEFTPNLPKGDPDIDYFGIWPGQTADLEYMDVQKMRIEVLP